MLRDWGCDYIQGRLIGLASSERPWQTHGAGGERCRLAGLNHGPASVQQ